VQGQQKPSHSLGELRVQWQVSRVSLEMSGYGAVWIRMCGFEVREGIREVVDNYKRSWHFTTLILVPYIRQGPWAVMYVEN